MSAAIQTTFFHVTNNMNPDQTAPWEQSDLGPYCLQSRLPKDIIVKTYFIAKFETAMGLGHKFSQP